LGLTGRSPCVGRIEPCRCTAIRRCWRRPQTAAAKLRSPGIDLRGKEPAELLVQPDPDMAGKRPARAMHGPELDAHRHILLQSECPSFGSIHPTVAKHTSLPGTAAVAR